MIEESVFWDDVFPSVIILYFGLQEICTLLLIFTI